MTTIHRHLAIVATALVALAACSASDAAPPLLDTQASATTVATLETSAPATTPETTTSEPAMTIRVTTTAPPETTTTPALPTTSPNTEADLLAEIEADLNEGEAAFLRGSADPGSGESIELARQFNVGTSLEFILNFYERLASGEIRYRPGDLSSFVEVLSLEPTSDTTANVRICRVDASVEYVPATAERGEVITDDRIFRFVSDNEVRLADGVWKLGDGSPVSETEGAATCDGA